jgi:hypothetical protein
MRLMLVAGITAPVVAAALGGGWLLYDRATGAGHCDSITRQVDDRMAEALHLRDTAPSAGNAIPVPSAKRSDLEEPWASSDLSHRQFRAREQQREAEERQLAEGRRVFRVGLQMIANDPECFEPAMVATAQERLRAE